MYTNVPDQWFVRHAVNEKLDNTVIEIAEYIASQDIEDDDALVECICECYKMDDLTADEIDHVVGCIHFHVALVEAKRMGIVTDTEGIIKLATD